MNGGYVIVVEDDLAIRESLKSIINDAGHAVKAAADGAAALEFLIAGPSPSLILLDLQMPIMDGPAFLEHKRARAEWRTIPVYLMTASAPAHFTLPGIVSILRKPFGLDEFLSIVERHC
jgi:CheY-like chemotaxis protein